MKKIIKILTILSILFIILNISNLNKSYADYQYNPPKDNITLPKPGEGKPKYENSNDNNNNNGGKVTAGINPDDYKPDDPTKDDAVEVVAKVGIALGFIRNISAIVSVIVLMIMGFKYMIGSVEEKANYKASMMPYVIGCIMAVSGTTLVSFIYNMIN